MKEKEQKKGKQKKDPLFYCVYWEEIYRLTGFKHFLLFKEVLPEHSGVWMWHHFAKYTQMCENLNTDSQ